jgi:hypothetical protein
MELAVSGTDGPETLKEPATTGEFLHAIVAEVRAGYKRPRSCHFAESLSGAPTGISDLDGPPELHMRADLGAFDFNLAAGDVGQIERLNMTCSVSRAGWLDPARSTAKPRLSQSHDRG